jgi:hypothetical protein
MLLADPCQEGTDVFLQIDSAAFQGFSPDGKEQQQQSMRSGVEYKYLCLNSVYSQQIT